MSERDINTHSNSKRSGPTEWATESPWHLTKYFERMESNPENGGVFKGYGAVAEGFEHAIQDIREAEETKAVQIRLKPAPNLGGRSVGDMSPREHLAALRAARRTQLYDDEGLVASQALMLLTYKMANAESLVDTAGQGSDSNHVIMHGQVDGKHVYFIERYESDDLGDYLTWTLMNEMPWGLVPTSVLAAQKKKPFLTTTETREMTMDFYRDFDQVIPTVPIEEADVVRSWISRRAA